MQSRVARKGKVFADLAPARLAFAARSAFGEEGQSMIIVIGAVTAQQASFDELRRLAHQHVERSRGEPGCVSHAMSLDSENPLRLVFVEEWADLPALQAHFAVPESRLRCGRRPARPQRRTAHLRRAAGPRDRLSPRGDFVSYGVVIPAKAGIQVRAVSHAGRGLQPPGSRPSPE